jgi:DNA-binding CsgD family transcriptional regulator
VTVISTLEQRRSLYQQSVVKNSESFLKNVRQTDNERVCRHEGQLLGLIEKVENWQSYLTDRQLQITKSFINHRSPASVDVQLNLKPSTAYKILFGPMNHSIVQGVTAKLQKIYDKQQKLKNKGVKK